MMSKPMSLNVNIMSSAFYEITLMMFMMGCVLTNTIIACFNISAFIHISWICIPIHMLYSVLYTYACLIGMTYIIIPNIILAVTMTGIQLYMCTVVVIYYILLLIKMILSVALDVFFWNWSMTPAYSCHLYDFWLCEMFNWWFYCLIY